MARRSISRLRALYRVKKGEFFKALDEERITNFQAMYYYLIMAAGLYLLLIANDKPQNVEPVMGEAYYHLWLALNICCPAMTLIGKRLLRRAAQKDPNRPNAAVGAAWFQLAGDFGVWWAINIFVVCVVQTTDWGDGLYGFFFVLMGVPGGGMFTLRSLRRIQQIQARAKRLT